MNSMIHAADVFAAPPLAVKPELFSSPRGGSLFLVSFFSFVIVLTIGEIVGWVREPPDPKPTAKKIVTGALVGTVLSAILAAVVTGIYMTIIYLKG